ncbi:MAG: hypothetical protein WCN81_08590 [Actinomycetes bacterium]
MSKLTDKAEQLEKAIQEAAFDGIQERRDYAKGTRLLEVAAEVWRLSERLGEIESSAS